MSTKTTFKRIALVAVAALGLGVLSVTPSTAAVSSETFTATADATSINVGESVTVTVSDEFTSSASDSTIINASVSNSSGGSVSSIYYVATNDTVNALSSSGMNIASTAPETFTSGSGVALYNKVTAKILLQNFTKAGTYYVSVYNTGAAGISTARKSAALTITVSQPAFSSLRLYTSTDAATGYNARKLFGAAVDSAISVTAGKAETPTLVGYILATGLTSAGDTLTTGGSDICRTQALTYCSISVAVSGAGLVSIDGGTTKAKAVTLKSYNNATFVAGESLTVYSDGTSGTGTISFTSGSTTLATKTVTFFGAAASAVLNFGETIVSGTGAQAGAVKAVVKDSVGNVVTSDVYLYSSDTKVISDSYTACSYSTSLGYHSCSITLVDSGTASVVVRDKTSVSTSTFTSNALSFTVRGTKIYSLTATFDKASYAPGEKAVLTITAKDSLGNTMDNGSIANAFVTKSNVAFTDVSTPTTYNPLLSDGVETRVVYMPTIGGAFSYTISAGTNSYAKMSDVVASATVADPTKDAADAATDAALEATDAAYAAQDAAQLAAEAADAATAAAEAATAAVEDLATQVASLFADLQKQITTLANVVAKIAKKVKA